MRCDLDSQLVMPQQIALTRLRPDLVLWSEKCKKVLLIELTVPWEENIAFAHERKLKRYDELATQCNDRGWNCEVFAVEVGCRGFTGRSTTRFLERIGLRGKQLRMALKAITESAEGASAWIWDQHCLKMKQV